MTLRSQRELEVTREKLRRLEEHYAAHKRSSDDESRAQQLSRISIKRLINQLKEEIIRYECRSSAKTSEG